MAIITRNKVSGIPATLQTGELAVETTGRALYVGTAAGVKGLLGAPLQAGAADLQSLQWNATSGEWTTYAHLTLPATGPKVAAGKRLELDEAAVLYMGAAGEFQAHVTSGNYLGTIDPAGTYKINDGTGDRISLETNGDVKFRGTDLYTNGVKLTNGLQRFRSLTQATYNGLGGGVDADTIYLIVN
jgi:hypothetical protein